MEEMRRGKETGADNWLYRIEILYRMDKNKRKKSYHAKGFEKEKNDTKHCG